MKTAANSQVTLQLGPAGWQVLWSSRHSAGLWGPGNETALTATSLAASSEQFLNSLLQNLWDGLLALQLPAGSPIYITVSDDWALHTVLPVVQGTGSLAQLRQNAQAWLLQRFELQTGPWRLAANWSATAPVWLSALPERFCSVLAQGAARHGFLLASLQLRSAQVVGDHLTAPPRQASSTCWLLIPGQHTLLALLQSNQQWLFAKTLHLETTINPADIQTAIQPQLQASVLRLNQPETPVQHWLAAQDAPGKHQPTTMLPDFAAKAGFKSLQSVLSAFLEQKDLLAQVLQAWAAIGFIALVISVLASSITQQKLDALRTQIQTLEGPGDQAALDSALGSLDVSRVNSVISQLNTPWPALFAALENGAGQAVVLRSLEVSPGRATAQVLAEAPTLEAANNWLLRLRATPGMASVSLQRQDRVENTTPEKTPHYRLQVELQWQADHTEKMP